MADPYMSDQPDTVSGLRPKINLSGLTGGDPGFSGQTQQQQGGLSGAGGPRGATPGIQGGMDLLQLTELFQALNALGGVTGGNASSLLSPLGAGSFGQGGAFGQPQGGQNTVAGQALGTQAGQTAGSGSGNTTDVASLLAKLFGVAKTGIGTASPTNDSATGLTQSDISGTTPEAQAAFAAQRQQERTASPSLANFPQGDFTGNQTLLQTAGPSSQASDLDILRENLPPGGEEVANLAGAGAPIGTGSSQARSSLSSAPGLPSPVNQGSLSGAVQGGLGAGGGLLNILQAAQNGSLPQGIGGGLQSIGGLSQLIQNSPALASALASQLGMTTQQLGSLLGGTGAVAGGLGGLLGLAGGAQTLASGGSPVSAATQLGSGALGTYGALSTLLPDVFPSLTGAIASSIAPELASEAAATTAASGATAGSLGIAAAPLAAIVLANTISGMLDTQHAAYGAQENYRKLTGDLPQAIQGLRNLPADFNLLPAQGGTPEQALAEIQAVNKDVAPWLNSGLYDFTEAGQTTAGGGWSGQDVSIKFPQGPSIFNNIFNPAFNAAEQQMIRAYDVLGQGGQSATSQIPGFDPASIVGLNFSPYNLGLQEIQRLNPNYQLVPSPEAIAAAGPTPWQTPPPGFSYYGGRYVPTDVMGDLLGLRANGGLMSGIQDIVAKERAGGYAPLSSPGNLAVANAASQYNPSLAPTAEQLAAQYATPYQDLSSPQA